MAEAATAWVDVVPSFQGMAKQLKSEIGQLDSQVQSQASSWGASVRDTFGDAFKFAGGAALAGLAGVTAWIGSYTGEALAASDATDKFKSTLKFAGIDNSTIEALTASSKKYADQTVYDLGDIQQTVAQLASNGVEGYAELAEAAGNLNAVAGGNKDTFKSVSQVMTQTAGAGKLMTENWRQLTDAIPGAAGPLKAALAEAGAYTGDFSEAMSKGEISAEEFNAAIRDLGFTDAAKEAATSTATFEGAWGNLEATIVTGLLSIIEPLKGPATAAIGAFADKIAGIFEQITTLAKGAQEIFTSGDFNPATWGENIAEDSPIIDFFFNLKEVGSGALSGLAPVVGALGGMLGPLLSQIPILGGMFSGLTGPVGLVIGAFTGMIQNSSDLRGAIGDALGTLGSVGAGLVPIFGQVMSALGPLLGALGDSLAPVVTAAADAVGVLVEAVAPLIPQLVETLAPIIEQIADLVGGFVAEVLPQLTPIIEQIAGLLGELMPILGEILGAVVDGLAPIVEAMIPVLGEVIDTIGMILEALSPLVTFIAEQIAPTIEAFMPVVQTVFGTVLDVISSVMSVIQGVIQTITAAISGDWSGAWEGIKQIFSGVWDAITGIISGALDTVSGIISGALDAIGSFFSNAWDSVSDGVSSAWDGIKNAVQSGIDGMMEFITSIPDKVKNVFSNAGSWLWEAGKAILQGLLDGIMSMWDSVKAKFEELTAWIPDWKGPADVDKVLLVGPGQMIMDGLIVGLESRFPWVRQSLQGLTSDIASWMSGPVSAASLGVSGDLSRARVRRAEPPTIYVENPWTGEQLRARVRDESLRTLEEINL